MVERQPFLNMLLMLIFHSLSDTKLPGYGELQRACSELFI